MRFTLPVLMILSCFSADVALGATLAPTDRAAAFKAAGFKRIGSHWKACDDPSDSYSPGIIETVEDLNKDGRPEAIITEGSIYCFGMTGAGYTLVSKEPNGSWRKIASGTGLVSVLKTKGVGNWPTSR